MDCFDREKERTLLWKLFTDRRNVLMLAPRRIGKTILLNALKEESTTHGFQAVVLDLEGYREEKDFFRQMCAAIQEEMGTGKAIIAAVTERLKRIGKGTGDQGDWRNILLSIDWKEFADHLLAQIEEGGGDQPWLFLVDELPLFVGELGRESEGGRRIHDFLYALRHLRQKHRRVRWLYTGSIGLDTVARRAGVEGALVDLEVVTLNPFDRATAEGYLAHLAQKHGRRLAPEAVSATLSRVGWLAPYYLEKIAEAAFERIGPEQAVTAEIANLAADSLLALARRTYWATWREHLDKNFQDPERTRLYAILGAVAQKDQGVSVDTLRLALHKQEPVDDSVVRSCLDTLEADGYLDADAGRTCFRFRMNLLREWWLRYVVSTTARE